MSGNGGDVVEKEEQSVGAAVRKEIEFYFSKQNLQQDGFLVSQMTSQMAVPLKVVAQFAKVKALTTDEALIRESVADSTLVTLTPEGIKPNIRSERCCVILREIPSDTPQEKVAEIFTGGDVEHAKPLSIRSDVGDTFFVTFASEEDAMKEILALRSKTFNGANIKARLKTENILRSFFPVPSAADSAPFPHGFTGHPLVPGSGGSMPGGIAAPPTTNYGPASLGGGGGHYAFPTVGMPPKYAAGTVGAGAGRGGGGHAAVPHGSTAFEARGMGSIRGGGGGGGGFVAPPGGAKGSYSTRQQLQGGQPYHQHAGGTQEQLNAHPPPPLHHQYNQQQQQQQQQQPQAQYASGIPPHAQPQSGARKQDKGKASGVEKGGLKGDKPAKGKGKVEKRVGEKEGGPAAKAAAAGAGGEAKGDGSKRQASSHGRPLLTAANFPPLPGGEEGVGPSDTTQEPPQQQQRAVEEDKNGEGKGEGSTSDSTTAGVIPVGYQKPFIRYSADDVMEVVRAMTKEDVGEGVPGVELGKHEMIYDREVNTDLLQRQRSVSIDDVREQLRKGRPVHREGIIPGAVDNWGNYMCDGHTDAQGGAKKTGDVAKSEAGSDSKGPKKAIGGYAAALLKPSRTPTEPPKGEGKTASAAVDKPSSSSSRKGGKTVPSTKEGGPMNGRKRGAAAAGDGQGQGQQPVASGSTKQAPVGKGPVAKAPVAAAGAAAAVPAAAVAAARPRGWEVSKKNTPSTAEAEEPSVSASSPASDPAKAAVAEKPAAAAAPWASKGLSLADKLARKDQTGSGAP